MGRIVASRWWPAAAAVLLGVAIGLTVALTGSTSRRAEAAVLVSSPQGPAVVTPLLPNLRELAVSSVLAGNVRSTLRLGGSDEDVRRRLHATIRPQSQVIVVTASAAAADRARQLAQEAAVVFTQLVGARFGGKNPPLQAAVLDAAHALSAPNRHVLRDSIIGAGAGLVLGAATAFLLSGGAVLSHASAGDERSLRRREKLIEQRIKILTARERALARRAGELAARERALAEDRAAQPTISMTREEATEPTAGRPVPAGPEAPHLAARLAPRTGGWNINDLERLIEANSGAAPEKIEERRSYVFFLRDYAAIDGALPAQFDALIEELFDESPRP